MAQAVSIEVRLPDRSRRASSMGTRGKPVAEVSVVLDDGTRMDVVVPVRAGRVLKDADAPLPCEVDDAFDYIHALEGRVCLQMLTEMLGRRDHSSEEAREKLRGYGFRDQEIDASISRARALRFLDDRRFAAYFIEERKRRGWGRRRIELELARKGVDVDGIEGYPEAFFSDEDDLERARALLDRRSVPEDRAFEKLTRFLMGKGFPYATASAAVRERLGG